MENFILYNLGSAGKHVRFEAMPIHVQQINHGTDAMVGEMLGDLGIASAVQSWKLRHYFSDYLSDDPQSDDWQVVWAWTSELTVTLKAPAKIATDDTELTRTNARDKTWKGKSPATFPALAVVVADLYGSPAVKKTKAALETWAAEKGQPVEVKAIEGYANKLMIELGSFDEKFFAEGAAVAAEAREIVEANGGTTNWNDRVAPEHR